ncbi:MAG TPA: 4-aminobutyrate--2-oxoglutarate transaminase [Vicinamibacterales bacterium]|nr:4-aminobutyrate--2-oxoglutarate transaminase [Vicinamibacterales bacterium]
MTGGPAIESWVVKRERVVPRGVAVAHPIALVRAEGSRVWDEDGRAYLDFASGIGTLNTGHRHPRVVEAVRTQLDHLMHTCFQVATYSGYVALCERLCALTGDTSGRARKAMLLTTGAEATENAIKIARAFTKRSAVVAFDGAFHGRSFLALAMTASNAAYRQDFGPFPAGIYHSPFPDEYRGWTAARAFDALQQLLATQIAPEQIAAMIIEPQLGEGGFIPAPFEFLRQLRAFTEQHGIVLIADEVQTGFGRTGRMFACQHAGIQPDLITLAKSLGGGMPLSAIIGTAEMMDAPLPGGLGGTYAGNPLACAAALAVLDIFDSDNIPARAVAIGATIRDSLLRLQSRVPAIGDVRGLGCMLAMELVVDRQTRQPDAALASRIVDEARLRGLLLLKAGPLRNVVRLLPPLTATPDEVTDGLGILETAVHASLS